MKEGIICQIIGKENIDELDLRNMFLRSKKKRKISLKLYIFGKNI
jgi:3,4-dihydroxy-2-butanone 4-phosphate synthase